MNLTPAQRNVLIKILDSRISITKEFRYLLGLTDEQRSEYILRIKELEDIKQAIVAMMTNEEYVLNRFPDAKFEYNVSVLIRNKRTRMHRISVMYDGENYVLAVSPTEGKAWRDARNKIKKGL